MTKTEDDLIADALRQHLEYQRLDFNDTMSDLGADCESPIERVMMASMMALASLAIQNVHWRRAFDEDRLFEPGARDGAYVHVQQPIGPYRVDFAAIIVDRESMEGVVIECDGHDFHEKTKEQAARDKKRDRDLLARGFTVLRFTGSEIWRDQYGCAREAITALMPRILRKAIRDYKRGRAA